GMAALDQPYTEISLLGMVKKRAGWLCALFLSEMLTATAMARFEHEIAQAVVLALFIPLIISSGGNSGSQATSLIIRAIALRELPAGFTLGLILGVIGVLRVLLSQLFGWQNFGAHYALVALTVGLSLI